MGIEQIPGLNFGSFNITSILRMGGQIGLALFLGIVIFAVMYFVFYIMSFNIPVMLFEKVGTSLQLKKDSGKLKTKDSKTEYKSKKFPNYMYGLPNSSNFFLIGKKKALLGIVVNNTCQWQTISPNPGFVPVDWNANAQYMNETNTTYNLIKPKQGWWDKYGNQAILAFMAICLLLAIIFIVGMIKDVSPGIAAAKAQANTQVM